MSGGPEFFQTPMGRRFYESTMPDVATALLRIAGALEKPKMTDDAAQARGALTNLDGFLAEQGEEARHGNRLANLGRRVSSLGSSVPGCRANLLVFGAA